MAEHEHHDDHGEFPGPIHQAPWVMWITLFASFGIAAGILSLKAPVHIWASFAAIALFSLGATVYTAGKSD